MQRGASSPNLGPAGDQGLAPACSQRQDTWAQDSVRPRGKPPVLSEPRLLRWENEASSGEYIWRRSRK